MFRDMHEKCTDVRAGLSTKELWCFQTVMLEKTLERLLDCKEIKPVNPEGKPRIFIRKTDAEAEAPVLWPLDAKRQLIGKDLRLIEGKRRKGPQRMRWLDGITDLWT